MLTNVGYLRSIYDLPSIIGGRVYLFGGVESGSAFNKLRRSNYFIDANAGIVIVTTFGPISVGGSIGEGGRRKAYFSIGRIF